MESGLTLGQLLSQEASLDPYQHRLCSKCVKIGGSGLSIMCPVLSKYNSPIIFSYFPSSSLHHEPQCSCGYPVTAKPWAGNPLGIKTLIMSFFRSSCPSLNSDGALPCTLRMEWQCVPAGVSHSACDDTAYTLILTFPERFLQHWCPISKVQAVLGRIRLGHRQSKRRPLPVPHGIDF